jgi:hypothetical protein
MRITPLETQNATVPHRQTSAKETPNVGAMKRSDARCTVSCSLRSTFRTARKAAAFGAFYPVEWNA